MARPRQHTDASIRKAYKETTTTREMARSLRLSTVSTYKHLRRLGLEPKAPNGRPDLRVFTDEEFAKAYMKHDSVVGIARELECSVGTVRKHMKRLGLKDLGIRIMTEEVCMKLFNAYAGSVTVRDLATQYDVSASSVRNAFDRVIRRMWNSDKPPQLPMPSCHAQIKVYNLLRKHPRLIDKPSSEVGSSIGVSSLIVARYFDKVKQ